MKFLQTAIMATAAAIPLTPTTATPIPDKSLNTTGLVNPVNGTIFFPPLNGTTPVGPVLPSNTTLFPPTNPPRKHRPRPSRREFNTEGYPKGPYDNGGVTVHQYILNGHIHIQDIDWAGDDGWMIYDELVYKNCRFNHWSYEWTGWDKVKYLAKIRIGWSTGENLECISGAIEKGLDVERVRWFQD